MPVRPEDLVRQRRWLPVAMATLLIGSVAAATGVGAFKRNVATRGLGEPVRVGRATVRPPLGWKDVSDWRSMFSPQLTLREPRPLRPREITVTLLSGDADIDADGSRIAFGERGHGLLYTGFDRLGTQKLLAIGSVANGESISIELSDGGRLGGDDYELVLKMPASVRQASDR